MSPKIAIIGAGAAGLMASATILEENPNTDLTLIEKYNEIGKKVLITGGGRCNLTNAEDDLKTLIQNYPRSQNFLKFALYEFPPKKVMEWFEENDLKLKIEENKRVFPLSNKSADLINTFNNKIKNAKILLNSNVEKVYSKNNKFFIEIKTNEKTELIQVDKLLITSGGQYDVKRQKSSIGYETAKSFGHKISELKASLGAFIIKNTENLAGIAFKNIKIQLKTTETYTKTGDFLFTHKGVSGPAIFALSSLSAFDEISEEKPATLKLDLLPLINTEKLKSEIIEKSKNSKSSFQNLIAEYIPKKLAKQIYTQEKKCCEISQKELNQTVESLKNFNLKVTGRVNGEEFVTAGGIDTNEIDKKTMESKICKNLYFAGEVLNIDGFTGGYNLQAAWATGRIAGKNIK